jgi:hypothetical protein
MERGAEDIAGSGELKELTGEKGADPMAEGLYGVSKELTV